MFINNKKLKLLFLILLSFSSVFSRSKTKSIRKLASSKVIIWDLGDTLLYTDKMGIAMEIGIKDMILYTLFDWKNPKKIKNHVFNILDAMEPSRPGQVYSSDDDEELPPYMSSWLKGHKSGKDACHEAHCLIDHYDRKGHFKNKRQVKLVKNTIKVMFDPELLAKHIHPIKKASKLLAKCSKNQNYILSNFDSHTYSYVAKKRKIQDKILKHFNSDQIIISADIGLIKPDPNIYKFVLKKFNLKPENCIVIDDQICNIEAARKCGMTAICIKDKNYRFLEKQLRDLGAL